MNNDNWQTNKGNNHYTEASAYSKSLKSYSNAGISADLITGYRGWRIIQRRNIADYLEYDEYKNLPPEPHPFILLSVSFDTFWQPGEQVTGNPGLGVFSGVYAWKNVNDCYLHRKTLEHMPLVHGTVNLWGRVIEHEKGFRAQFAYPKTLIVKRTTPAHSNLNIVQCLRRSYGVNVEWE
jgi:hypothetical protein